jgi:hypothetical protein
MMLNKLVKGTTAPLLMIFILLLSLIAGCNGEKAAPETTAPLPATTTPTPETTALNQLQIQQILVDTIMAVKNTEKYKFSMDMTSVMIATGGTQAGDMNMSMNATGYYDQINKNAHLTSDINIDMDFPEMEEGAQSVSMDMYLLEGTIYIKMNMPVLGEQWLKMTATEEMLKTYNTDMVNEQLKLLESPGTIEFLRYETLEGNSCYVFKIIPDMKKIMEWVMKQQMADTGLKAESAANIADMFKDLTYNIWVTKDDKLITKMDATINMEFTKEQLGETSGEIDGMTMSMDMVMKMYDYNVSETIILPEEAKDAIEIPGTGKPNKESL